MRTTLRSGYGSSDVVVRVGNEVVLGASRRPVMHIRMTTVLAIRVFVQAAGAFVPASDFADDPDVRVY